MIHQTLRLYESDADATLTAYVIGTQGILREAGRRPAVLICPGGAYLSCSDREGEPIALAFSAMGYQAFVLRYHTCAGADREYTGANGGLTERSDCRYPGPMYDVGQAILTIRDHAEEWMVDCEKIILCGFSAGAHNAAMYSVKWNSPMMAERFGGAGELLRPAAAILCYTLSDYVYLAQAPQEKYERDMFRDSMAVYLGTERPSEEQLREVSPCLHVTSDTPPMFLWATAEDRTAPVQHTLRMAAALADKKVPFEMHIFESGEHGLALATQATSISRYMIDEAAAQWIGLAETWIKKRFALPLPEKAEFELMLERMRKEG